MRKLPSPWSILWADNVCTAIATSIPMVLFIGLMIKLTGTVPGGRGTPDRPVDPEVATLVLACAVALILILSLIISRRVARIRGLFDQGREVEASVRKATCYRGGRQKLELAFELYGIPYEVRASFLRSSKTPAFREGMRIRVLVDPASPKRVVPAALFGDSDAAQSGEPPTSASPGQPKG